MFRRTFETRAIAVAALGAAFVLLASDPAQAGGGLIWGAGITQINMLAMGAAAALAVLGVVVLGVTIAIAQSSLLAPVFYLIGGMSIAASAAMVAPMIVAGAAVGGIDLVLIDPAAAATIGGGR